MNGQSMIASSPKRTSQPLTLRDWLPTRQQMRDAVQLRMEPVLLPPPPLQPSLFDVAAETGALPEQAAISEVTVVEKPAAPSSNVLDISMRQGMGLIVVLALLAGLIPFLWNWILATRLGTSVPLMELARLAARQAELGVNVNNPFDIFTETARTIVGLGPRGPVWLAAGLTALGEWINWPLRWLALWIVYGLGVLVTCLLLGATTTLQRFYAVTSYAAIPLLLTGLSPVPCLGFLAVVVALVWSVVMYVTAVRAVTGLDLFRVIVSVLAPIALAAFLGFLALTALITTLVQLVL